LKFGQVAVVVQGIPVATAVLSQLVVQVVITLHELWQQLPVKHIRCVQVDHGLAIGHIPAMQVWAVDHMLMDQV
jgi:hypothetical protein